jgi:hypothetical protein
MRFCDINSEILHFECSLVFKGLSEYVTYVLEDKTLFYAEKTERKTVFGTKWNSIQY